MASTAGRDIKGLREYIDIMKQEIRAVEDDPRWSDQHKRDIAGQRRAYWQNAAKDSFAAGRRRRLRELEEARKKLEEAAARREQGIDYARMNFIRSEVEAELKRPPNPMLGDKPTRRVAELANRARASGDREALRAIRLAAADLVAGSGDGSDEDLRLLVEVRRGFSQDIESEWHDVRQAEQEVREAEVGMLQYDQAGLQVERELYNLPPVDFFSTLTAWQRDVLGMTPENSGMIVERSQVNAVGGGPANSE